MLRRGAAGLILILAVWLTAIHLFRVPAYLLPTPLDVVDQTLFLWRRADLARHIQVTGLEIIIGFVFGAFAGIIAAFMFSRLPMMERISTPLILLLQTAPKIAIAPLLLLFLGIGPLPKIVLISIVTFFPVMTGTLSGLRFLPSSYHDLARVLRLTPLQSFWHIELPAAVPPLIAGATVATTLAMTAAVIGELMGANEGLGYLLAQGQENANPSVVIAVVLILSFMGWIFYELFEDLRRRCNALFTL